MITVPATFRDMPRWWHDQPGRTWLDALPALVAEQCRRWGLELDGAPLHGSNALVVVPPAQRRRLLVHVVPRRREAQGHRLLAGERAPWLVVDPVMLRGDPEHDLARVLWSRLDEVRDDEEVRQLVRVVVRATGVPEDRARSWIVLRSLSYLRWGLARGLTWDPPKCRRLLDMFA